MLLDYPVHQNVGDLLIWHGERAFLKRHGKKLMGQFSINNFGRRANVLLDACATICIHGGGNFGDIWPWFQKFHERIIHQYPHKRVVMLPQSVHYRDLRELDRASKILKAHPDLHIFVRDRNRCGFCRNAGFQT